MELKKVVPFILDKGIVWVSPKRILMLAFMAIVTIFSITLFEERSVVNGLFTQEQSAPRDLNVVLSERVRKRIDDTVIRSPLIVGARVVSANLKVNQRAQVYYYTDDPVVQSQWDQYIRERGNTQAIFSSDQVNNLQMVAVINGEFACSEFKDSLIGKVMPSLEGHIKYSCRVGIPPYYGDFSGYLVFWLKDAPDEGMTNEVRIEAVRLANDIYKELLARR